MKTYHNKVYQGHCVKRDVPPVHKSSNVHYDHRDCNNNNDRREDIQTHEQEGDDKNSKQRYTDALQSVRPHR